MVLTEANVAQSCDWVRLAESVQVTARLCWFRWKLAEALLLKETRAQTAHSPDTQSHTLRGPLSRAVMAVSPACVSGFRAGESSHIYHQTPLICFTSYMKLCHWEFKWEDCNMKSGYNLLPPQVKTQSLQWHKEEQQTLKKLDTQTPHSLVGF